MADSHIREVVVITTLFVSLLMISVCLLFLLLLFHCYYFLLTEFCYSTAMVSEIKRKHNDRRHTYNERVARARLKELPDGEKIVQSLSVGRPVKRTGKEPLARHLSDKKVLRSEDSAAYMEERRELQRRIDEMVAEEGERLEEAGLCVTPQEKERMLLDFKKRVYSMELRCKLLAVFVLR